MKTKEEYRAAADKRMQPLLDTLRRRLVEKYDQRLSEVREMNFICEDCHKILRNDSDVVEAIMKYETPVCPECGGSMGRHIPETT